MSKSARAAASIALALLAAFDCRISRSRPQELAAKPVGANAPLGLGRVALPEEIKAWDTDVRFDGAGLAGGQGHGQAGRSDCIRSDAQPVMGSSVKVRDAGRSCPAVRER